MKGIRIRISFSISLCMNAKMGIFSICFEENTLVKLEEDILAKPEEERQASSLNLRKHNW